MNQHKITLIENVFEKQKHLLGFLNIDLSEKNVYLYGKNAYSRFFINNYKIQIKGFISDDSLENYCSFPAIHIDDFIKNYVNDNVIVVCFFENFIEQKLKLLKAGFSSVSSIFDGLFFINCREEYDDDIITDLILSSPLGIFKLNINDHKTELLAEGQYAGLKNYENGYLSINNNGLIQFDNAFKIINEIKIPNIDSHGLDFDKIDKEKIFVVETATNSIGIYDIRTKIKEEEIRISEFEIDRNHVNDILVSMEYIYLSMFSLRGDFINNNPILSKGHVIKIDRKGYFIQNILANDLLFPHTIEIFNNDIFYCDSIHGRLFCNDEVVFECNGFLRGIFNSGYCVYVGQSTNRRPFLNSHKLSSNIDSGIHCFYPSTKISRFIPLPKGMEPYSIISPN